jgi:SPX domain protein involved in polyphosphate accumulation
VSARNLNSTLSVTNFNMKFGDTFAQRSVPEWAAFNLNYALLKDVVKKSTSSGHGCPVDIPQLGKNRWEASDQALFNLLKDQLENVALFLKMKTGEMDRRMTGLVRQIASLRTYVNEKAMEIDVVAGIQGRKYRKLSKEVEELGDLIQKVARFSSAQKIALRKLLKKYTKWTGSTALQTRVEKELLTTQQLKTDYSDLLQELAEQKTILVQELAAPMLRRQQAVIEAKQQQLLLQLNDNPTTSTRAIIAKINDATKQAPAAFDAALTTVPYGEAAGSAMYWVHPENLDEARALLYKTMKRHGSASRTPSRTPSRANSQESLNSLKATTPLFSADPSTQMVFFDNAERFVADASSTRHSKVALSACWTYDEDAAVALANLAPTSSSGGQTVILDREDLPIALDRNARSTDYSKETTIIQQYLREQRDVKPLASFSARRTRYSGLTNTSDVATWATLDSDITVGPVEVAQLGKLQYPSTSNTSTFPYSILHIRWEFARIPAIVRAFDESHLAFKVNNFTVEDMAIRTIQPDIPRAFWQPLLAHTDITNLPLPSRPTLNRLKTNSRAQAIASDIGGTSSGPSSSEGRADSIFSSADRGYSSVTSEETRAVGAISSHLEDALNKKKNKKKARIVLPEPERPAFRYWNEFDDGDSDVNPQEEYAIYLDPDEPMFPALSRAWAAVKAAWPVQMAKAGSRLADEEEARLLDEEDAMSVTSSETDSLLGIRRRQSQQGSVWGVVAGIGATFLIGVLVLAYVIFSVA